MRRRWASLGVVLISIIAVMFWLHLRSRHARRRIPIVTLVSRTAIGEPANGESESPAINADGRWVAFSSRASNLVPEDTNGVADVFVFDRQTQTMMRASVSSEGVQGNGPSTHPSMSADGRFVAFLSAASNLDAIDDTNQAPDIFLRDRRDGITLRVTVDRVGRQTDDESGRPAMSANGRLVVFASKARTLAPGGVEGTWQVYLRDPFVGISDRISGGLNPAISASGDTVAFEAMHLNGIQNDRGPFGMTNIYTYDHKTGAVNKISQYSYDGHWAGSSERATLNADGRVIAFESGSALMAEDGNRERDIYIYDQEVGGLDIASRNGMHGSANGRSEYPSLSADGRFIAFVSEASNLVAWDTNKVADIFVHDRRSGATSRVNLGPHGEPANAPSSEPMLSADGRFLAFASQASNLLPKFTHQWTDIFVAELPVGWCESL